MKTSEFVSTFSSRGFSSWEAAAVDLVKKGEAHETRWLPISLDDGTNQATAYVSDDYFTVGEGDDLLRLPLTPERAQDIANLKGALLPTPWLVYRIWQASQKVGRRAMVPNMGANLAQYVEHNSIIDQQIRDLGGRNQDKPLSGHKKDVVISNIYKPGVVVIFGWYKPEPDVWSNNLPMTSPERQPQQPLSNVHGAGYVDYSHGIRLIHPIMKVNGKDVSTEEIYTGPMSKLVSHEGPIKTPRYPSKVPTQTFHPSRPAHVNVYPIPTDPGYAYRGYQVLVDRAYRRSAS